MIGCQCVERTGMAVLYESYRLTIYSTMQILSLRSV